MVGAFSPVALTCAAIVLLTGVVSAWLRLGAISPLWTSGYGRMLLLKVALLVGVAGTGAYNWLRVKPALGTPDATSRLRRSATVELAVGIAVIAVTAILVALPTPI
jgi:putative copper export protein